MQLIHSHEMQEGDGVTVRRLFPIQRDQKLPDPFVLWDDFTIGPGAGFPTHAHRGFEAITYLFNGAMNHADNLGNNSTVTRGGAQRFTAGKGIQHSEMPGEDGKTQGIQLWINLPRSLKGIDPDYQRVNAEQFPIQRADGVSIRHIVGQNSPLRLKTPVRYQDINMTANANHRVIVEPGMQGLIYLHAGEVTINDQRLLVGDALLIDSRDQKLLIESSQASRLMLALGKPHQEPVYLNGGFVD